MDIQDKIFVDGDFDPISIEINPVVSTEGLFDVINNKGLYVEIKGFPFAWFNNKIKRAYKTTKIRHFYDAVGIRWFGKSTIKVHKFFIPELIYLLTKFRAPSWIKQELIDKTWVKSMYSDSAVEDRVSLARIHKSMDVKLFPYQEEFISQYDIHRQRCSLRGQLLSFGCGLGKTITSLCLAKALGIDRVIVLAPKATLYTVWEDHIKRFYRAKQKCWIVNRDEPADADFYVFNYESMDKVYDVIKYLKKGTTMVIVDESHNFLRIKSNRTQNLIKLRDDLNCNDMILMSGTPLKQKGLEMIPLLRVIDGYFDEEAELIFAKAFGVNTTLATDILHSRMNMMMYRKTKEEVLDLPEKTEEDWKVVIKDGDKYIIENVKKLLLQYMTDREHYHNKMMPIYRRHWQEAITFLTNNKAIGPTPNFKRYLVFVAYITKNGYNRFDKYCVEEVVWANRYEREVLIPSMSPDMKKDFRECKSAIKYLPLKIQGETLGYLGTLRGEMTAALLDAVDLVELLDRAIKKTIFFTSFVDVVETADAKLKSLGYNPALVYGGTKSVPDELKKFKTDKTVNPLIATIQTLATGVTLTEANQSVFINRPWRQTDYDQASDRIYRIGQDTDVTIVTLTLDTGDKPNLSTRMGDILSWSKEMSDLIVTGEVSSKDFPSLYLQ